MGRFLDFFSGGNHKIICREIADMYRINGNSYEYVFYAEAMAIYKNANASRNPENLHLLNNLENLSQLANLKLNMFCAPKGTSFSQTWDQFGEKIVVYLEEFGVDIEHVCGCNILPEQIYLQDKESG